MNTVPESRRVMDFSQVLRTTRKLDIYQEIEKTLRIPGLAAFRKSVIGFNTSNPNRTMRSLQESMRTLLKNGEGKHFIVRRNEQALINNKDNIWDHITRLEWELEMKENIFIKENVELLRDGDIVVGGYFNVDQIRELISMSSIHFPKIDIVASYKEVQNRVEAGKLIIEQYYTSSSISEPVGKECRQADRTQHEQDIYVTAQDDVTGRLLADTMRYCRLRYGVEPELAAIQHFGNGPFLFLCAHWLMRKCIKERIDCMLLSTRDCRLLKKMLDRFQELSTNLIFKKCEINLYYCSKDCFENNSVSFLQYTHQLLNNKNKVIYVDLWGFQPLSKKIFFSQWPVRIICLVSQGDRARNVTTSSMYEEDAIDSNPVLEYLNHDIDGPVIDVSTNTFEPLRAPLRNDVKVSIQSFYTFFDFFMDQITPDMVNIFIMTDCSQSIISILMIKMRGWLSILRKKNLLVLEAGLEEYESDDVSREIQKSAEKKTILSFDMFDTLVFRRGRLPRSIFVQVGIALNDFHFCTKRIEAEIQSGYGTFDEIYKKYQELHPEENVASIQKIEFQIELENLYPVLSTFLFLKPQDIIVSDMYLSENQLRQILNKCLEICWIVVPKRERYRYPIFRYSIIDSIPIVVSLHGKSQKWIWKMLPMIDCHIGDNYHSDVISPLQYGIRALHFSSAQINTPIEEYLHNRGQETLANLCRHIRLLNPYFDFRKKIYEEQSQINIPLLVLLAIYLHSLNKRILFMLRDGFYLKMVYDALYPGNDSEYLFCSRKAMKTSSPSFVQYMKNMIVGSSTCSSYERKTLIFDLFGTGLSIWQFLRKHEIYDVDTLYFFIYDCSECPRPPHLFRSGSDYIEKMNYVYFGSAIDIDEYDHRLRYCPEYDHIIIQAIQKSLNNAIQYISSFQQDLIKTKISTEWLIDIFNHKTNVLENYCLHVDNISAQLSISTPNNIHMICFYSDNKLLTAATQFRHYFSQCTKTLQMYNQESIQQLPGFDPIYIQCYPEFNYGEHSRGYSHAFWRWKPFVILNRLLELKDGDLLVYHDNNVFRYPYYIDYCNEFQSCAMEIFGKAATDVIIPIERNGLRLDRFCKKETFEIIGRYDENYRGFPLLNANRIFLRKSALSIQFVQEWLNFCLDDRCLLPEKSPEPPLLWHTHDQAVLCVLYKKYIENCLIPSYAPGFTIQDKVLCHQNIQWTM